MKYSVALSEDNNDVFVNHLLREDKQEDLCFCLYAPVTGNDRYSGVINTILLPKMGDRNVHGNASFNSQYFDRVITAALNQNLGIGFIHSHPVPGWQSMSQPDIEAELMLAPRVKGVTGLPLLGLTIGTDQVWSARFWIKTGKKQYERNWCESVRVVGKTIKMNYANHIYPNPKNTIQFTRTISAWGEKKQNDISRLKVGIIGLGSVGSLVAEGLQKTGIRNISLIDFDQFKTRNRDRQHSLSKDDVGRLKVYAYYDFLRRSEPDDQYNIKCFPYSIIEEEGFKAALDCDIIFSCVDRPWPRYVLNSLSYANLIPVIDGGIDASMNRRKDNIGQARWRDHIIGPKRKCLECLGQFTAEDVSLEISGNLEDSHYINNLPSDHFARRGENVFIFSMSLASQLLQQFLSLVLYPCKISYPPRETHFRQGKVEHNPSTICEGDCNIHRFEALGDLVNSSLIGLHEIAASTRNKGLEIEEKFKKGHRPDSSFIQRFIHKIRSM